MKFLARRLGHRGAFLGLLGLIWCLIGVSVLPDADHPHPASPLLFTHIPVPLRLVMWLVPGLVALVCAWLRGPGKDTPGFALLIIPVIIRAGCYCWAWLLWVAGTDRGDDRAWVPALVWAAIIGVILIVSSWREPDGFAPPIRDLPDLGLPHEDGDAHHPGER